MLFILKCYSCLKILSKIVSKRIFKMKIYFSKFITFYWFSEIKHVRNIFSRDLRNISNLLCRRCDVFTLLYESHWRFSEFRVPTTPISIGVTRARLSCFRDSRSWCVTVVSWRLRGIPLARTSRSHGRYRRDTCRHYDRATFVFRRLHIVRLH